MRSDIQVAHPDDDAAEVAQKIAEYNLLALPVRRRSRRYPGDRNGRRCN